LRLFSLGSRIRHPFYPGLAATPARRGKGICNALAGAFLELTQAARNGIRVRRAVFVLLGEKSPFLTEAQRDELWRLFEVPVYALLLDRHGRVVGFECEATRLHWQKSHREFSVNGHAPVERSACPCGRPVGQPYTDAARARSAAAFPLAEAR
jgi:hypothetical protein